MPATSTIVGASLGLGVQLYSNAVRKLPLLRSACPLAQPAGGKRPACANPKRTCTRPPQTPGSTSWPRASAAWWARTWLPGRCALDAVQPSLLPPARPRATSREHARFPGLQERVTKEVADLEAKRAKRFAGARA